MIKLTKQLYNKEIISKAAFSFTNDCFVSLDADDDYYYIAIERKDGEDDPNLEKEFGNEVVTQAARYNIMKETKELREIIIGRALASTILNDSDTGFVDDESFQAEDIIYDWFERHDTK